MIADKARELGRLIGQSEEYKALRRARERLSEESELRSKLERLNRLTEELERLAASGGQPSESQAKEYEELVSGVQAEVAYQSMVAAQSNFDKYMMRVNEHILEGLEQGATSSIITLS